MPLSNFDQETLQGENPLYQQRVDQLHADYGFDFVAIGMAAFQGGPLRWIYSAGATSERFRRITLAPGHGIGGIVLKAGKPMLLNDIDVEMDPREYSSYPIVFAEDLHSFCALPLTCNGHVVGVLLCAFRSVDANHAATYRAMLTQVGGGLCGLDVVATDIMDFETIADAESAGLDEVFLGYDAIGRLVNAQEEERRRISRDIHDGVAQEVLAVSFLLGMIQNAQSQQEAANLMDQARTGLDGVLEELHNISVELRPSTLDHFGLVSALMSQGRLYEKSYGARVVFDTPDDLPRFNKAQEIQVYRVCQEALLNSCKYSGADSVTVSMEFAGGCLCTCVRDEGDGFDVEHPIVRGSGVGLGSMRERAAMIGATLEIESGPGGTAVSLVTPIVPCTEEDK